MFMSVDKGMSLVKMEEKKEKIELIKELIKLRNRVMELEEIDAKRRQVEDALRESETQLRVILNSLGDAIHVVDKKLHLVMMNTSFQRWNLELGLKVDVIGKKLLEVFPFLPESVKDEYQKVFKNGEPLYTEERSKVSDREIITETRKIPIYEKGNVTQVITIVRDVTKRKKADEALKESEERFRGIAEESFDIIFIIDIKGNFSYISPAVQKITGYSRDDILGKSLENFLPESEYKRIKQASDKLMTGEILKGLELEIIGKKYKSIFVEVNATPITKDGEIIGYQGIARDITDRKHAEEEMKKRLMKFKLEQGKVYLVEESANTISHEVLSDLVKVGYTGLVITRSNNSYYENRYQDELELLWLSENGKKNAIKPSLKNLQHIISNLHHKRIIYIDRLDYLISKRGYKRVLSFVQNLIELATFSNHIIILSIDPSTLSYRELRLLEKETSEIEPMVRPKLPEDLVSVLRFVYEQNVLGIKPSYSEVESELGVCKPTMRKRIRKLITTGYLNENSKGRSKVVELSERGRVIFQ